MPEINAIIVTNEDISLERLMRFRCASAELRCSTYPNTASALELMEQQYAQGELHDLCIVDADIPPDGIGFVKQMLKRYHADPAIDPPAVMLLYSGNLDHILTQLNSHSKEVDWYREKPVSASEIMLSAELLLARRKSSLQAKYNVRNLTARMQQLITESKEKDRTIAARTGIVDKFFAMISHEIRTPVNNIINYAEFLREKISEEYAGSLETFEQIINPIQTGSARLARTIDTIINYAQIISGEYMPTHDTFHLSTLLQSTLSRFDGEITRKHLQMRYESTSDPKVEGDRYSVEKLFEHLIDNAIKYTIEGTIHITLDERQDSYQITFADNGIGIAPEIIRRIFDPFIQESAGYSRKYDGIGLGLSLAYRFAKLNHIELYVKSEKSAGTRITLLYPKDSLQSVQTTVSAGSHIL